jgi:hypothetical protein
MADKTKKVTILSYPIIPNFGKRTGFWKVTGLCPIGVLVRAT